MQSFNQSVGADSPAEAADHPSGQSMTRPVLESWLRLQAIDGVGDLTVLRLVRAWHSPEAVLRASCDELIESGCSQQLADAIQRGPDSSVCRSIEQQLKAIERERVEVRSVLDPAYPARLKMIADPPPLLYITGTLTEQDELAVAIVGARRATAAGRAVTRRPIEARSPRRGVPLRCWAAGSIEPIRRNMSGYAGRSRNGGRLYLRYRWVRRLTAITFLDGTASSAGCP